MTTESGRAANEIQIRTVIDDRTKALGGKDRIRATSGFAPDILTFDVVSPLQNIESDASRKRVEEWFASFQGPVNSLGHMIAWGSEVARRKTGRHVDECLEGNRILRGTSKVST
jgi:hypothetical protein